MSGLTCPSCMKESPDGLLCDKCAQRCVKNLLGIADLWPALEDAQVNARKAGSGGKRNDVSPLPYNERAGKVASYVRNQVTSWVRDLADEDDDLPADTVPDCCRWLAGRMTLIRRHEAADEIVGEFGYCRGLIWSAVDLPPDRVYCGPCSTCGADLLAKAGALDVVCHRCEIAGVITLPVDVVAARAKMSADIEGMLLTRDEILTAMPSMFGVEINRTTLWRWVKAGRLVEVDKKLRVADVLDLAHGEAARSA